MGHQNKEAMRCIPLINYHIAQTFDGENFDELIMGFKGETLKDKGL